METPPQWTPTASASVQPRRTPCSRQDCSDQEMSWHCRGRQRKQSPREEQISSGLGAEKKFRELMGAKKVFHENQVETHGIELSGRSPKARPKLL